MEHFKSGVMMKMKNTLLTALIGRNNISNRMDNIMAQMSFMTLIHPNPTIQKRRRQLKNL
jgi:hypothetical protein